MCSADMWTPCCDVHWALSCHAVGTAASDIGIAYFATGCINQACQVNSDQMLGNKSTMPMLV